MAIYGEEAKLERVIAVTQENFDQIVSREGIVLVDCWASWCPACKTFSPIYEAAAERHPEHTFAKLDTQKEKALAASLGVTHIPTLILYRDGLPLYHEAGSPAAEGLEDIILQAEGVDMSEVRRHLASQQEQV